MNLTVRRSIYLPTGTLGMMSVNGELRYSTLERPAEQFTSDVHSIPAGTYPVILYASPHFNRIMPLLMDVPGHQGIEIHWGNYPDNSRGCILVGMSQTVEDEKPAIWNTRAAFDSLFPEIEGAQAEGCTISVIDD